MQLGQTVVIISWPIHCLATIEVTSAFFLLKVLSGVAILLLSIRVSQSVVVDVIVVVVFGLVWLP